VIHSVLFVCWQISIDYKAVDKGCLQNPIEKWIPIVSGYKLGIKIGSILVTSGKVQIDYRLRYAHTRTRAAPSKLPVDPYATRSL